MTFSERGPSASSGSTSDESDLAVRGLDQLDGPVVMGTDEQSGFPVITIGRRVTSEQVAAVLDEERRPTSSTPKC
jgi:hypothetical protein